MKNQDFDIRENDIGELTLYKYQGSDKNIEVPDGVVNINPEAFIFNFNIETVKLPKSIKAIRMSAFRGCKKLNSINFPDSLKLIGRFAFADCESLRSVCFNKNVMYFCYSFDNHTTKKLENGKILLEKLPEGIEEIDILLGRAKQKREELTSPPVNNITTNKTIKRR